MQCPENCINVIENAVDAMKTKCEKNVSHEIEGRMGTRGENGNFIAGVDPEWFEALVRRLECCNAWSSQKNWIESEDTSFNLGKTKVRQSRICNPRTCAVDLITLNKKAINSACIAMEMNNDHTINIGADTIRVAYSSEKITNATLPAIVEPQHVRIKQRRFFTQESTSIKGAKWNYELTRTWSGKTREEAEHNQNTVQPVCEVEIEWQPPDSAFKQLESPKLAKHLTQSLLQKMNSLQ